MADELEYDIPQDLNDGTFRGGSLAPNMVKASIAVEDLSPRVRRAQATADEALAGVTQVNSRVDGTGTRIGELEEKVSGINAKVGDIATNKSQIGALKSRVDSIDETASGARQKNGEQDTKIANLTSRVGSLENRTGGGSGGGDGGSGGGGGNGGGLDKALTTVRAANEDGEVVEFPQRSTLDLSARVSAVDDEDNDRTEVHFDFAFIRDAEVLAVRSTGGSRLADVRYGIRGRTTSTTILIPKGKNCVIGDIVSFYGDLSQNLPYSRKLLDVISRQGDYVPPVYGPFGESLEFPVSVNGALNPYGPVNYTTADLFGLGGGGLIFGPRGTGGRKFHALNMDTGANFQTAEIPDIGTNIVVDYTEWKGQLLVMTDQAGGYFRVYDKNTGSWVISYTNFAGPTGNKLYTELFRSNDGRPMFFTYTMNLNGPNQTSPGANGVTPQTVPSATAQIYRHVLQDSGVWTADPCGNPFVISDIRIADRTDGSFQNPYYRGNSYAQVSRLLVKGNSIWVVCFTRGTPASSSYGGAEIQTMSFYSGAPGAQFSTPYRAQEQAWYVLNLMCFGTGNDLIYVPATFAGTISGSGQYSSYNSQIKYFASHFERLTTSGSRSTTQWVDPIKLYDNVNDNNTYSFPIYGLYNFGNQIIVSASNGDPDNGGNTGPSRRAALWKTDLLTSQAIWTSKNDAGTISAPRENNARTGRISWTDYAASTVWEGQA